MKILIIHHLNGTITIFQSPSNYTEVEIKHHYETIM